LVKFVKIHLQLTQACKNALLAEEMQTVLNDVGVIDDSHADAARQVFDNVFDRV